MRTCLRVPLGHRSSATLINPVKCPCPSALQVHGLRIRLPQRKLCWIAILGKLLNVITSGVRMALVQSQLVMSGKRAQIHHFINAQAVNV